MSYLRSESVQAGGLSKPAEVRLRFLGAAVMGLIAAAGAPPAWGQSSCHVVPVQSGATPPRAGNNAEAISAKLDGIQSGIGVKALDRSTLLVCADAATTAELVKAVERLSADGSPAPEPSDGHSVRLFFNRDAASIATALSGIFKDLKIQALGSDTLVFQTSDRNQEKNIHELRRWISILDSPRPEVSLNIWSVQLSSHKREAVASESEAVQSTVSQYNYQLQSALERAWKQLDSRRRDATAFFDPIFVSYVTTPYGPGAGSAYRATLDDPRRPARCDPPGYCLGFEGAFNPLQPALTHMLGVLSAAKEPIQNAADSFVNALENRMTTPAGDATADCEAADDNALPDGQPAIPTPAFHCLRQQLHDSLSPKRKALLRRAIADFLFQYKISMQYPHDLSPYDFSTSAQALDNQFDPLLVAFNRDIAAYLRHLQRRVAERTKGSAVTLSSYGIVTARTISGVESELDSTTQNSFKNTPPPLVQDFVAQLGKAEAAGGTTDLMKANLPAHAATALAAFLNSGQSSTVTIGRALNLKITPVSLQGASSAELKLHLESKDDGTPQVVAPDGTAKNDTTDRVSSQTVDTSIRVESLKLFEVSSFSAGMSHGRDPIPLLPPLVRLPYIGSFLQLNRSPASSYHQTFAIVSAVVVPTASDMLNGLRFLTDNDPHGVPYNEPPVSAEDIRYFHQKELACIVAEANPADEIPYQEQCQKLQMPRPSR